MTEHRAVKNQLFAGFAEIGKAVSSAARLEILDLLAQGERSVEEIARETDQTVKNASAHLRVLRQARVVEARREGKYQYYGLAHEDVFGLVRAVQNVARHRLAEVEQLVRLYYEDPDQLEPVRATELRRRLSDEEVIVLDVRPAAEYAAGHIPTACSIPIDELESRLGELPPDHEIIAYCRGPYCLYSVEAVELLRRNGYRARRLEDGPPDWRSRGYPIRREGGAG